MKRGKEIDVISGGKVIVAAPEIDINGSSKVIINSPDVELGNGTLRKLIDERFVAAFNSHTNGGHAVDTPLVLANVATAITEAS